MVQLRELLELGADEWPPVARPGSSPASTDPDAVARHGRAVERWRRLIEEP
jgi:hypothetical protein